MGLQLQSILAAVDMSPASATVVSRAAMIATEHGVGGAQVDGHQPALRDGASGAVL